MKIITLSAAKLERGPLTILWLALAIVAGHAQTPTVATLPASAVGITNATLNGVANPQSSQSLPTTAWFVWGIPGNLTNVTAPEFLGGGHNDIPFSQLITGLAVTSTYSYFAVASNSVGVVSSTNQSFTTIAAPDVSTLPATAAGSGAATLNGVANPHGGNTIVWFELGTTTNYGSTTASQSVGSGNNNTNFSTVTSGYSPGTTLQFRAVASNSAVIVYGTNQSYTIPGPPTVATLSASSIGGTSATLNGVANPEGAATFVWFQWGTTASLALTNTTPLQQVGSGFSNTNFSQVITGLTPGVDYSFYAVVQSSLGGSGGGDVTNFTTLWPPTVSTLPASDVSPTSATLNALANSHGTSTTGWFEWGTTTNYGNVTSAQDLGSDPSVTVNFNQLLSGLSGSTGFHFRAVVSNSLGVVFGADQSFTTPGPPTVSTLSATLVGPNSATLYGVANPNGLNTTVWFELGTTTNYGTVLASQSVGSGNSNTNFSQVTPAIGAGTTIQFRAVASNSLGIVYGTNQSYTIPVRMVDTLPATAAGPNAATLNGVANPAGANMTVWFELGTTTNYSNTALPQFLGNGGSNTNFSEVTSNWPAGTTLQFRAVAFSGVDYLYGTNQSYTIPGAPTVGTLPPSSVGGTSATFNGAVDPEGLPTAVWFTWGPPANMTSFQSVGSGFDATNFSLIITGLVAGTTYSYSAFASNSAGVVSSTNQSFTTPAPATLSASKQGTSGFQLSVTGAAPVYVIQASTNLPGGIWVPLYTNPPPFVFVDRFASNFASRFYRAKSASLNGGVFSLSSSPGVGSHPYSVVAADVNGDGKPDLISANNGDDTLSVLLNDGTGAFGLPSSLVVGSRPISVVAADVNGDGKPDLISANYGNGTLSVLINDGTGSFALASSPAVGPGPDSVTAADVNGDGKVDLISANYTNSTLSVLTNNGSGGFVLAASPAVGIGPYGVVAADVNGDGRLDLISVNYTAGTFSVLTNDGSGGFVLSSSPNVVGNPVALTVADINGDGKPDLISASFAAFTLTVLTNNGTGGFVLASSPHVGIGPYSVVAADANGDGRMDLITANYSASTLSVMTNKGGGSFVLSSSPGIGLNPFSVTAADVNGDGRIDLISANYNANTLSVLLNH